tara:strand:+ start:3114 stop:3311 length:198 start_codon:yes stop_codon:yes gene_type:complete
MTFVVVKDKQGFYRVKNSITGKVGRDRFAKKVNADIQQKNRERFINLIQRKTGQNKNNNNKVKKK